MVRPSTICYSSRVKKLTLQDVRLSPNGRFVTTARVSYCGVFDRYGDEVRKPGADWSAINRYVNARRKAALACGDLPTVDRGPGKVNYLFTRAKSRLEARLSGAQWIERHEFRRCRTCEKEFVRLSSHGWSRYCSERCAPRWKPPKVKPRLKACEHCGAVFTPARSDARTCGTRCRVALHRSAA